MAALGLALASAAAAGCLSPADDLALPELPELTPAGLSDDLSVVVRAHASVDASTDSMQRPSDIGTASSALSAAPAPSVIYLAYADGVAEQKVSPNPCPGAAPKFVCQFAADLKTCQQQIQAYLDRWYASFNVVFTLTRPTSGSYYTEVISSGGGAWCGAKATVGGIAPFLCNDLAGGVAYTFAGGRTAKETAVIIAQEQAHLVGLEHSASNHDVMYPTICSDCDGFENIENKVQNDVCGRPNQNSYQLMTDRLGVWSGGVKTTPFGCSADVSSPAVTILEPSDKAMVDSTFVLRVQASDDCRIAKATVQVTPMGLQATSTAAPFEWTLTKIKGQQKITVSVTDPSNKTSTTSITVTAGTSATPGGSGGSSGTGGRAGTGGQVDAGGSQGGGGGTPHADGGGLSTDAAALSARTSSAGGCEVGGCAFAESSTPLSSTLSLLVSGLLMLGVRRRRSSPLRDVPRP